MFVLTAKVSKPKLIGAAAAVIAVIVLLIALVSCSGTGKKESGNGKTNEQRLTFLAGFGWSVNAAPTETQEVRIPSNSESDVFARYNDLQRSQGFDLTKYAGKRATRYVYEILNYPEASSPVYATILVYRNRIIGGDVTSTAADGAMHGFAMP